ncbi:hypothetical protein [Xanthomonas sp. 3498]|uniref:hypothetical protein n=1 Tax=Xanthomonas sp. 3498 TaxID=2663863 RepID=UPI00161FE36F|nr:hypothetical protein [Xanthomonas sp. 3498]MBB5875865.1 hypothetical protein [Xanthomonas sp. 3498]
MDLGEAQQLIAHLLGRCVAAEKAVQTLIGSPNPNASIGQVMRTNLVMRRQSLGMDLAAVGLPAELLPAASQAFVSQEAAVHNGLAGGKYFPPGWPAK